VSLLACLQGPNIQSLVMIPALHPVAKCSLNSCCQLHGCKLPHNLTPPCVLGKQEAHQGSTKQTEPLCRDCRPKDKEKREAAVVRAIMRKIFVNLKRLHGMGIVHRDVKPVRHKSAL
jgi:hypothetical protein